MSGPSAIEWTERTWNPIVGCSIHSAGCTNCYAMKMAGRLEAMAAAQVAAQGPVPLVHYLGTTTKTKAGFVWTGKVNVAPDTILMEPLRRKKPTTWFVNSMSDLFHESVPDEVIDRVFAVMALCPQHRFQVLTKRADRMWAYCSSGTVAARIAAEARSGRYTARHTYTRWLGGLGEVVKAQWPLPNVWLGVSVEDQRAADERIPHLLATPAAVRFLSCEPLLGPVDLTCIDINGDAEMDALNRRRWSDEVEQWRGTSDTWEDDFDDWFGKRPDAVSGFMHATIDWVIWGGESGPGARDFAMEWGAAIVGQCREAGVPVFGKQLGTRPTFEGRRWNTDDRKGGDPAQWPEALRVRQMPGGAHV